MGLFDSIFGGGTNTSALRTGAKQSKKFLQQGIDQGVGAYDTAQTQYTPQYQTAAAGFSPFQQQGVAGNAMYGNALGLNGQTGYDTAAGAFHNTPGFQFGLDAANQNILRNQAQTGGLNSGNTLLSLGNEAQGRQNQEWNNWLANLSGIGSQGLQGAQGQANALQALGGQIANTGAGKADVYTGGNSALATNASNLGLGLQNQTAADQASQLSLLNAILGGGAKLGGAYFG